MWKITIITAALCFTVGTARAQENPFGVYSMPDSALAQVRGREDTSQVAINVLTNEVSNTSVGDNVNTGTVSYDSSAFSNLNGFALVSSNTGNNVSFNANMTVNIIVNN